jgi:hypothetical protein
MLSGELDHTNHLQYCLGDTDKVLPHKYDFFSKLLLSTLYIQHEIFDKFYPIMLY